MYNCNEILYDVQILISFFTSILWPIQHQKTGMKCIQDKRKKKKEKNGRSYTLNFAYEWSIYYEVGGGGCKHDVRLNCNFVRSEFELQSCC